PIDYKDVIDSQPDHRQLLPPSARADNRRQACPERRAAAVRNLVTPKDQTRAIPGRIAAKPGARLAPLGLGESRAQTRIGRFHRRPCLGRSHDTFTVTVVFTRSSRNSSRGSALAPCVRFSSIAKKRAL